MAIQESAAQSAFTISQVAEATGVPAVTLRAWERRYDFLKPRRTESGHRVYDDQHLRLIRRVVGLLETGVPVGRVMEFFRPEAEPPVSAGQTLWDRYRQQMLDAVQDFDESRVDAVYNEALSLYAIDLVTRELVVPVMRHLGNCWDRKFDGIAQEHFFSLYIRNKLGSRWHHSSPPVRGFRLLACCLPGEQHEFGLMFFALTARNRGLDLILLGSQTPLAVLPGAADSARADGIVLSSTIEPGWQVVERDIRELVLAVSIPVFVGGAGVSGKAAALEAVGAIAVGSELVPGVDAVYSYLSGVRGKGAGGDHNA